MHWGNLLTIAFGGLAALLVAVLTGVLSDEVSSWLPRLSDRIVTAASKRFRDPAMRERAAEEWRSILADIPGPLVAVVHALSFFFCVRHLERQWSAALGPDDVTDHFSQLERALLRVGKRLTTARRRKGLSLEDVSRSTNLTVKVLQALEAGQLRKVPHGLYVFAYMGELRKQLDPNELDEIQRAYEVLVASHEILPPAPERTWMNVLGRLLCAVAGHRAFERFLHSKDQSGFHFSYYQCDRCGDVSTTWVSRCWGTRSRVKLDHDSPAADIYSCDRALYRWPSNSLRRR